MELFSQLEGQYGLPAGILDSIWNAESGRGKAMLSPKGAQGHFQFMPATAKQYGVQDPADLTQSATGAARMLSDLLAQSGGDVITTHDWKVECPSADVDDWDINQFPLHKKAGQGRSFT